MRTKLTPHFIELTLDAILCSFWRKESLKRFLRQCGVPEPLVSSFGDETKRAYLGRLIDELSNHGHREEIFAKVSMSLIEQKAFPDLTGWEDTATKLEKARNAVQELRSYVEEQDRAIQGEEIRRKFNEAQAKATKALQNLEELSSRLNALVAAEIGTQAGGYQFQDWFYDLAGWFEIVAKKPYVVGGRQIDGSVTLKDTTFLVELKFTKEQAGATDIDTFIRKVETKADNTMGVFVSMYGFSSVAIDEASKDRAKILLLDHSHVYHVLGGRISFPDLIDRLKRHASQTGRAYLPIADLS